MKRKLISSICALTMLSASVLSPIGMMVLATDTNLYVLSNNTFTDADKTLYSGEGVTINSADTGANYSWSSDSNSELRQFDAFDVTRNNTLPFFGQEMIGGNLADDGQNSLTWTSWDANEYSTAQFDLKGVYSVSSVDVWGLCQNNTGHFFQIGDIQVYAGATKDSMSLVWQGNGQTMTAEEIAAGTTKRSVRTPAQFNAVNARYVNVKFKKAASLTIGSTTWPVYQARIGEIVIFGALPGGTQSLAVGKALGKANDYLAKRNYYTTDSVVSLDSAAETLEAVNTETDNAEYITFCITEVENAIAALVAADTHYTLSGNNWIANDTTQFYGVWDPDMVLTKASNSARYTWATGGDAETAQYDSVPDRMNGGNIANGASGTTWSKWDSVIPGGAIYNLGGKYNVDRVDVIQDVMNEYCMLGYTEVYTSEDGKSFQKAATTMGNTGAAIANGDGHSYNLTTLKFPLKKAQYVAIILNRDNTHYQARYAELAVFGYVSDMTTLDNALTEANQYIDVSQYYTNDSIAALQTACSAASALTDNDSKAQITAAVASVRSAIDSLETINQRLVVSGNSWIDLDKSYYQALTPSITLKNASNSPTYIWAEGSSGQCTSLDTDFTKMKGGSVQNFAGPYGTSTAWDDSAPGIALWNLGAVNVIDRVDVFSGHEQYKQLGSVTVSVSENGTDFTNIKTVTAAGEYTTTQTMYLTTLKFVPVKAQYVKVTCNKATGAYMTNINEMVIFGIGADYSGLSAEIAKYDETTLATLSEFATEDSYNTLVAALDAGKAMITAQSGTNTDIAAAVADIKTKFNGLVYKETEGIITNNADATYYPGYSNLSTGLTYKIESADSQLVANDSLFTKLTAGGIAEISGSAATFGSWDGAAQATITANAGEEVYFTGADLYEIYSTNAKVANIVISVSADGKSFTDVTTVASTLSGVSSNVINKIGTDFVPVKGQYLRITTTRGGHQQVLSEIVIKAFKVPHVILFPLTFGQSEYTILDPVGENQTELTNADLVSISGLLINETADQVKGKVITAIYNDAHKLLAVTMTDELTIAASGTGQWSNTLSDLGGLPAGSQLVNYVWSSSQTPIAAIQTK